ncbi:endonuclease/exonuclease/phosphatase family protein [bacterium]|nr:endonuclease/exonuclease/phosphatase family protein [bacterium]
MKKQLFFLFLVLLSGAALAYQPVGTDSTIDMLTWNIEYFPKANTTTISTVAKIITDLQVDLIAVQEIANDDAFNQLIDQLDGWNGLLTSHTYGDGSYQKVGLLYREAVVTVNNSQLILTNDGYNLPRPPMQFSLLAKEGGQLFDFELIVVHLKAYGDATSEQRRRIALQKLKAYIDNAMDTGRERDFVLCGDFNDEIDDPETSNVFSVFHDDPDNYAFLTAPIAATGSSYIGNPPLFFIDHFIASRDTDEEFGANGFTRVLRLDSELYNYRDIVSDHRPVLAQFSFGNAANIQTMPIADLQNNFGDFIGQTISVSGIITISAGLFNSGYTSAYIQDDSGAGINIFLYGTIISELDRGVHARVTGLPQIYNGLHELVYESHEILTTGQPEPEPVKVITRTLASTVNQGRLEQIEGEITSFSGDFMQVNDGSGNGKVYIDSDAGLDLSAFSVGDNIRVSGVKTVYSNEGELIPGYQDHLEKVTVSGINPQNSTKIRSSRLVGTYPNPFNPATIISLELDQTENVSLTVVNVIGQQVAEIMNGRLNPGTHKIHWDAASLPSGTYFILFQTANTCQIHKTILLK